MRIKPFFQQIFIEDKTDLILLLHQKTYFANIYDICNLHFMNVLFLTVTFLVVTLKVHLNMRTVPCFACFLSFLLIPFVQLMIP